MLPPWTIAAILVDTLPDNITLLELAVDPLLVRLSGEYKPATLYLVGWGMFITSAFVYGLRAGGFVEPNAFNTNGIMIASVLESVLFALALAYRFRLIEQESQEKLDAQVIVKTKELQDALDSRRMMLVNASHELRTPTNSILLQLESALMAKAKDAPLLTKLKMVAEHMSYVVETQLLLDPDQVMARENKSEFEIAKTI